MAVRYVVEDSSWRGEVNVPRKEFGFNRLRYLWEHCPTGLLYFPNASQDDVNHDLARDIRLKVNALRFGYISIDLKVISLKYANGLRNGANSDTHRCKQLTEHGEERCIKLREVAGFSAVRTIFQIVGPRKILHCLLGK